MLDFFSERSKRNFVANFVMERLRLYSQKRQNRVFRHPLILYFILYSIVLFSINVLWFIVYIRVVGSVSAFSAVLSLTKFDLIYNTYASS